MNQIETFYPLGTGVSADYQIETQQQVQYRGKSHELKNFIRVRTLINQKVDQLLSENSNLFEISPARIFQDMMSFSPQMGLLGAVKDQN
jgi:hypothetical protein